MAAPSGETNIDNLRWRKPVRPYRGGSRLPALIGCPRSLLRREHGADHWARSALSRPGRDKRRPILAARSAFRGSDKDQAQAFAGLVRQPAGAAYLLMAWDQALFLPIAPVRPGPRLRLTPQVARQRQKDGQKHDPAQYQRQFLPNPRQLNRRAIMGGGHHHHRHLANQRPQLRRDSWRPPWSSWEHGHKPCNASLITTMNRITPIITGASHTGSRLR